MSDLISKSDLVYKDTCVFLEIVMSDGEVWGHHPIEYVIRTSLNDYDSFACYINDSVSDALDIEEVFKVKNEDDELFIKDLNKFLKDNKTDMTARFVCKDYYCAEISEDNKSDAYRFIDYLGWAYDDHHSFVCVEVSEEETKDIEKALKYVAEYEEEDDDLH